MSVRVTRLPGGLTIATDAMPQVDTVSLGAWVGVGTRDEPDHSGGIAHLLEHMAFKGTERRSARDIAEAIEDVGGHLNAYTSREQTAYYAKVLAEDAPLAIDIVSDILLNSRFDEAELTRERTVVLQEIGQAIDTPDDIIFDQFQATAFPDQPLGRPVLGEAETVERLSRQDLFDYLHTNYGAGGMVVAASGRIDHDRFVAAVAEAFAGLPTRPLRSQAPARYAGGEHHEDRDLEQVHVVLGFPGVSVHDPDYYAHQIYSMMLGGGMSSRLFQEVREKRGLVYSIYSFSAAYRDAGLFGIYAGTGEDQLGELMPVVCDELAKMTEDLGEAELGRARAQLRAGTLMARESTSNRVETVANQLLIHGRPIPVAELIAKVDAVSLDDIRRVARTIVAGAPSVATLGPRGGVDPYDILRTRLR